MDELTIRHVMASGALLPVFPAVRIDGELYWDGGILSNTPVAAVSDDNPRMSGVIFTIRFVTNAFSISPSVASEKLPTLYSLPSWLAQDCKPSVMGCKVGFDLPNGG
jgi:predicted acylesterase/phospholipase RssA